MLKFAAKFIIAALILWYVLSSIDTKELWLHVKNADPLLLVFAFASLIASTLVSGMRLGIYLNMPKAKSIPLYYSGMFFNTMLPGGISGDGYIAYYLRKRHNTFYKRSISVLLLNRANGLFFLNLLFYGFVLITDYANMPYVIWAVVGLFVLQMPVYFYISRKFLGEDMKLFLKTAPYSLGLQVLSVLSAFFVFEALGETQHLAEYISQFIAASIAGIVPITPGGVGIRELVFYKGSKLIGADAEFAVAASLVYFTLYMVIAQTGVYFLLRNKEGKKKWR